MNNEEVKSVDIVPQAEEVERVEHEPDSICVGEWYWVKIKNHRDEGKELLMCVTDVGSNYVQVESCFRTVRRIHIEKWPDISRREHNYKQYINERIADCRERVQGLLEQAKEITRRLGVTPQKLLTAEEKASPEDRAIAALSESPDPELHIKALIKAKDEDLPEIFDEVRKANDELSNWMGAETLHLNAQIKMMRGAEEEIDAKVFNVSIYAGLQENVYHFAKGDAAPFSEKLHVMQRKLYMDEECLLNYKHGGMDFEDIDAFNRWLAEPENRDRVFPFSRCMVVMQVRRDDKKRDDFGNLLQAFINMKLRELDKKSVIYIRNGDNLYAITTKLDFPDKTFPDNSRLNLTEPHWAKASRGSVYLVPDRTYQQELAEHEERVKKWRKNEADRIRWNRKHGVENPSDRWAGQFPDEEKGIPRNPFYSATSRRYPEFEYEDYDKFDDSNVYFDDIKESIKKQAEKYNRIALIIQGILDRSEILHPHPPICIWKASDFNAYIELVYDHDYTLYDGEEPDIEAYLYENNQRIGKGSIVVGQDDYWQRREARRENDRADRNWRGTGRSYRPERVKPYGDPGPGEVAVIKHWKPRARKAVFRWLRESRMWDSDNLVKASIEVPAEALFCVSAYKPGDYLKFFKDPRTRSKYLKWAPTLLLAEEYHANNIDPETGRLKKPRNPYSDAREEE